MSKQAMWCLVMFDLPTQTKAQRREYARFRNSLLDLGFFRVQFSVYAHYSPLGLMSKRIVDGIKSNLPVGGEIRILHLTDKQWASMIRFYNATEEIPEPEPAQLMLFLINLGLYFVELQPQIGNP